jgi:transcription elongation factor Elf1
MPVNPLDHEDDEVESKDSIGSGTKRRFKDFDCPDCNANNPRDEPFGDGEEVLCYYCGQEYKAHVNDDGKLKLKVL